jgi:uncharacterized membrane protein HdeD (DUF308 family)
MVTGAISSEFGASLQKHRGWFLVIGIIAMCLGVFALGAVGLVTLTSVVVFGWVLMFGGVVQAIHAFRVRVGEGFFLYLLSGILRFVVGILLVSRPLLGAASITLLLAAYFLVAGCVRIVYSLYSRFQGWGWVLLNGVVTLVLGLLIVNEWPSSAFWVIGLFVGIDLLFDGWAMIGLALAAGKPAQAASEAA